MSIIKYKEFNDSKTLENSIRLYINKLFQYDEHLHRHGYDLLMLELKEKIKIKQLDSYFDNNHWTKLWGPVPLSELNNSYIDSFYIYIKKICYHSDKFILKIISAKDYI